MGAELAITSGGVGPCPAGYYGILHQEILNDLGHNMQILVLEPPLKGILDFIRKIKQVKPRQMSWRVFWELSKKGWSKLQATDDLEQLTLEIRPYEINRGDTTKALKQALTLLDQAQSSAAIQEARAEGIRLINAVAQDRTREPLRIGIIGEIYVVLEPAANYDIQNTLGEMGVYVNRSIWLTNWSRDNILSDGEKDVRVAARPYLNELIGGHGINSVGETVLYAEHGYDGVIQLAPFSCIPEIVAKGILPKVSRDFGIPVLTIFIDEQTGKAGIQTRLEAFIDLLTQKKEKQRLKANLA